ncbi:hypothetical protein SUDANB121_01190 [Nocardiopsis dassonvillei]|uniref:hypothetical protein n=1 Tax=Nocardiopsis dassonvillei TaxID=2014 RepID=UPI003F57D462
MACRELDRALVERSGLPPLDFSRFEDRVVPGELPGRAVDRTLPEAGVMVSAIMVRQGMNDPGPGFHDLAVEKGLSDAGASRSGKRSSGSRGSMRHAPTTGPAGET